MRDDLKNTHTEIPWRAIADMRNVLAHQYFEVDHEKVDKVIENSLQELKQVVVLNIEKLK